MTDHECETAAIARAARAEAERRYPGWVNGTVPMDPNEERARESARETFIEGAEWAVFDMPSDVTGQGFCTPGCDDGCDGSHRSSISG